MTTPRVISLGGSSTTTAEIRLTGELVCRNAAEAAIVATHLPEHIELTRAEPGCLSFEVAATDDPLVWTVEEHFASEDAFAAHQTRVTGSDWGRSTADIERHYEVRRVAR